ncbi:leucine-rich repeat and IQ domain-containing protein 3 [Rhinophrynus dorsalis]
MEESYLLSASESLLLAHGLTLNNCPAKELSELALLYLNKQLLKEVTIIKYCISLRICILSNNYVTNIGALRRCCHIIKLDLHGNQIQNLPDHEFWSELKQLKLLYLHDNRIGSVKNIESLSSCPNLKGLTLFDTPISLQRRYRHMVVNRLWSLNALDNFAISDEEIIEDCSLPDRFKACNPHFYLNMLPVPNKEIGFHNEMKLVTDILTKINHILAHYSPVLIIQKWIRGYLTRKTLGEHFSRPYQARGPQTSTDQTKSHLEEEDNSEFRLMGLKATVHELDPFKEMLILHEESARHVRNSIQQLHTTMQTKLEPVHHVKNYMKKRAFEETSSSLKLLPLLAVDRAFENRQRYDIQVKKRNLVMQMQTTKKQAKSNIEQFIQEKRKQALEQNGKHCSKCHQCKLLNQQGELDLIEKAKLRHSEFCQVKREKTLEILFVREFNTQHTSVTKTLQKHEHMIRCEREKQEKTRILQDLKEENERQKLLMKSLKENRMLELKVKNVSCKVVLASLALQKITDRLLQARTHGASSEEEIPDGEDEEGEFDMDSSYSYGASYDIGTFPSTEGLIRAVLETIQVPNSPVEGLSSTNVFQRLLLGSSWLSMSENAFISWVAHEHVKVISMPSQWLVFLGMMFNTHLEKVFLPDIKILQVM